MIELFPAIDILDNKVVRLAKGKYDAVTVYNESVIEQARMFEAEGARWVHVVDLEGARSGTPTQMATVEELASRTSLTVEVGGGVRTLDDIQRYKDAGASRVVVGTKLTGNPEFVDEAIARFDSLLCAGVDALEGKVAIQGWQEDSGIDDGELISSLKQRGLKHVVYTDISKDGMQTGIDAAAYQRIARLAGFAVTASGGIATLDDITALAQLGQGVVEAIIVGRALYEQSFTVKQALEVLETYVN